MAFVPFDDRDGFIWVNGDFVPWREAKTHVLTHALHYGSSVFEGERMYGGEIFKLTPHSERLKRSAELLDFEIPYSVAEIDAAWIQSVLRASGIPGATVRSVTSTPIGAGNVSDTVRVTIDYVGERGDAPDGHGRGALPRGLVGERRTRPAQQRQLSCS